MLFRSDSYSSPRVRTVSAAWPTHMNFALLTLGLSSLLLLADPDRSTEGETLLELAAGNDNFTTLVAAVEAAGLSEALAGEGPLTVFAPTNAAFAALGDRTLQELLSDRGRPQLRQILLHHVVPGAVTADEIARVDGLETLAETKLDVNLVLGRVTVGGAGVEAADLPASNGVVHVIDRVLLPSAKSNAQQALLSLTIERGAALFNNGDLAACCAVYATALDALRLGRGFGLTESDRGVLQRLMSQAETARTQRELAWAYRGIIDAVLRGDLPKAAPKAESDPISEMIFDFEEREQVAGWTTVLDGVMGGLSTGKVRHGAGTLIFDGETSLENNGGFSSMRCAIPDDAMDGADSFQLRVKGDGRTYIFGARSSSGRGGSSFWYRFDTVDGEWLTFDVKVDDLERNFFGQRMRGKITPAEVRALEFYVYDKKAGPFRLEIDEILATSASTAANRPGR